MYLYLSFLRVSINIQCAIYERSDYETHFKEAVTGMRWVPQLGSAAIQPVQEMPIYKGAFTPAEHSLRTFETFMNTRKHA